MAELNSDVSPPDRHVVDRRALRRQVLVLALPALGEQLLNFCVSLFDTYLAGQVTTGNHEIGVYTTTIGISAYISWLATLVFSLVGTGTTALVARSRGAGDFDLANRFANRSLTLVSVLGLLVFLALTGLAPLFAEMQGMQGDSFRLAVRFMRIDAYGHLFYGFCLIGSAALRGMGDMRTPMFVLGVVNVLNMLLASTLVFGWGPIPPWGIDGIVTGTLIARFCGGLLILGVLARGVDHLRLRLAYLRPHAEEVWRILRIGAPAALDGVLMWTCQWLFLALISHLGEGALGKAYVAAHVIGMDAEAFTYLPATAWGYAAAVLVGQSLGAGAPQQARRLAHEAARQCVFVALVGAAIYLFGAHLVYGIMTKEPQVQQIGIPALRFLSWYQIPLAVMIVYIYALRGAGDTRAVMLINLVGIAVLRLPVAYLGGKVLNGGLIGAWSGMCVDVLFRMVVAWLYFRSGRWMHTRI
ncbi:MAG: MATE family efflux transporter [Planctomycetes bacterium]|nr:MATE family efflux transporter [Planctomycetota bacterium]